MLQCSIIIINNNEEKYNNNVGLKTLLGATLCQNRTSADGYPDSLIKINEILDFDRFSDGP